MHCLLHKRCLTIVLVVLCAALTGCEQSVQQLPAESQLSYSIATDNTQSIPMVGFVEFDERVEVAANTAASQCVQATYAFHFDYDTSVFVEFREGKQGYCSYGAVMTKAFGVKIMTDEDFPVGTQLSPVIQFHQRDPHHAVFQIGSNFFNEKVSDLQALEISCRRQPCDGAVTRRPAQPTS